MSNLYNQFCACVAGLLAIAAPAYAQHPVLSQVSSLSAPAPTSPLIAFGEGWTPLVAGGDGAKFARAVGDDPRLGEAPQLVAVARQWGNGRILCTNHPFTDNIAVGQWGCPGDPAVNTPRHAVTGRPGPPLEIPAHKAKDAPPWRTRLSCVWRGLLFATTLEIAGTGLEPATSGL